MARFIERKLFPRGLYTTKELSGVSVCASTNLSQPLVAATTYLRNQFSQVVSHVNPENTPQPRLAVILLSDGYDATSEQQFQNLQGFLKQSPQVTVHTLGYGESLLRSCT